MDSDKVVILDQIEGRALILFVEVAAAVRAFKDTKIRNVFGKRVMCDYANDTLKRSFCKNMEASGQTVGKSWKLSYSAGDERELSSAYYDYSADRSYFSPVRESYQEEYPFEQRSRSRDLYSEANSYSSDYRGSRYNDSHYGMSAYAGVREYSDMHRGLKRKRDWAESVYDRPYF
ncbi:msx2-interacting protein-like [Protopterus annectens]|uniref:msx2-interacting protein-like n=1 Tax=Protopterus annectens TaxID=7888 RepID=UPI001CFA28B3|nr:msx2-interacting protein-like [Protopterus annectens]